MQNYKNLISMCRLIKQKDEYIAQATGYNFNIFSILDRERYEVGTHSYFLYELLNPNGKHNQKIKFLEIFLTDILGILDYGEIHNTSVMRESLTKDNRRIDFVIECENIIIGIEMKIDAGDQKNQLFDYYEDLKFRVSDKKDIALYYLTLSGSDASDYSLNGLSVDNIQNLSFEKDIYLWIKSCMESVVSIPILRDALNQYLILVENLTGKKENMVDEISDLLLKDDNLAVAIELEKSVEKAKTKIQKRFWKLFIEKLGSDFKFVDFDFTNIAIDKIDKKVEKYYGLSNNSRYYGVKHDIVVTEEYTISYYIELHSKLYHGLTVSKNNKRASYCLDEQFKPYKEKIKGFNKSSSWWLGWNYFQCQEIDFYTFNSFAQALVDKNVMDNYIACLANEVKTTLDNLRDVLVE